MTIDQIMFLGRDAMIVTLLLAAPMLLSGMIIGLLVSILQSVTQIQEITLTFVPKIFVVLLSFVLFMPWMGDTLLGFVVPLLANLDTVVR
ncbi:MAG: flagellar biosynthesis protein FliQ [Candidatus Hydrogenedentes bacterium]|nr:flagellar biosynthesis protein FliQ [Candidatus Hydrogenedentota bacterium]